MFFRCLLRSEKSFGAHAHVLGACVLRGGARHVRRARRFRGAVLLFGAPQNGKINYYFSWQLSNERMNLGFVLSLRLIASAPGPLERVCGEWSCRSSVSSHSPGARSVGCPRCRVGTLFKYFCRFFRQFVVPLKYSHGSVRATSAAR